MYLDDKKDGEASTKWEPWRQLLLDTANLLERDGWCQGVPKHGKLRCVVGAMADLFFYQCVKSPKTMNATADIHEKAIDHLQSSLSQAIAVWNDEPGQTAEKVVAQLRRVATCS